MSVVSVILIVPAARRQDGHGTAVALGHDDDPGHTYSVPLSPTGNEPVTHYGCHWWDSQEKFEWLDRIKAMQQVGQVDRAMTNRLGAAIRTSIKADGEMRPRVHFDTFAESQNLREVTPALDSVAAANKLER
jgi:hypothetical protein